MNKYQEALNKLSNEYNADVASIEKFIQVAIKYSPKCFINTINELIIEPKNNIYFRLDNVDSMLTLKCKVLAWLSRPSCKGVSSYYQKK